MTIDWNNFTPWTALAGGVLIARLPACSSCSTGVSPE